MLCSTSWPLVQNERWCGACRKQGRSVFCGERFEIWDDREECAYRGDGCIHPRLVKTSICSLLRYLLASRLPHFRLEYHAPPKCRVTDNPSPSPKDE